MRLGALFLGLVLVTLAHEQAEFKSANIEYEHFFNHGHSSKNKGNKESKLENEVLKSKVEVLGEVLKHRVQALRNVLGQKVELVFLVDSSASVGAENFFNELKFVKKLLADFTVSSDAARVAVVTFSSKNRVVRHIDHLSTSPVWQADDLERHKCRLLEQELPAIGYTGGGTYTLGAILEAQAVLEEARPDAVKAVFLITDGYSNGGDPRPAAKRLREQGVRIFTFGIRNGNVKELFDMASEPAQEHSYIVDSFEEFEALARRALHEDLQTGSYLPQRNRSACDRLCKDHANCCHSSAECTCGTHTGHYACLCPPGHYGTGIKDDCHPCPGGTYRSEGGPGDVRSCRPCPDENHISPPGSTSVDQCQCPRGYVPSDGGRTCQLLACPKLEPPANGYFVKQTCNSVFNGACGIRCNGGYRLVGSSIRLCQENGTWSGEEATCQMRSCGPLAAPKNGHAQCTSNDYVIDSECTFSCDPGYTLVGSRTRVCLPIGYWDGLPAFCKPVFCNPLPKLMNGTLLPSKCPQAKMRYGEQCNATCAPGFELRGPAVRKCSDQGAWTDEDVKTRCVDITPPDITCPPDASLEAEEGENFASFSWDLPKATDNSGAIPDVSSVPAITEQPMRFRIGASIVTYRAQDRRGNQAECSFQVTVADTQPPTIDQCESPPIFLLHDRDTNVTWDEPIFSDNSGKELTVTRSHDPGPFPLGETQVVYTAFDESGNNSTCTLTIKVQEHACHLPVDPIHGQANCSQQPDAVYCSLTCHDGYAFAMPPPRSYFCAYDGQWLPADNPLPFPDCSVTTHSDALIQDGLVVFASTNESDDEKMCQDPFLMSQMEGHFKRRLAARLNDICGDNMICQIDDLQAECRQVIAEDIDEDWEQSNEIPRSRRHARSLDEAASSKKEKLSKSKNALELRFKVFSRFPNKTASDDQEIMLQELNQIRALLLEAAQSGEFNILSADRMLNVTDVKIGGDERPGFSCPPGSVQVRDDDPSAWGRCVLCPVGTFFNVVNEVCESCSQGSYQPQEGKLSCLVCPNNTSTKVVNAKTQEDCQAQCLAGSYSPTGLEPCSTCPQGTFQSEYSQRHCQQCPEGMTTWRRGARRIDDCKSVCPKGYVSETGLAPCFACPAGYYQPLNGQRFCIRCPKRSPYTASTGAVHRMECLRYRPDDPFSTTALPEAEATEEFEEASLLEVNECFSLPCLNGGQCQTLNFGYVCSCPSGYTGMQCQTDIDECASTPCLNGATCVDGINKYECKCAPGFTGLQCQTDVDECLSGPCQNGATCVDRTLGYSCICPPGMAGPHCEMEVDECVSGPCQNGATCYDRMANYSCSCAPGWTGKLCEQPIDECLSQPCQNGATCEDLIGQYACHCPPGYRGIDCEEDIDECDPVPCSDGSTCVDRVGSFSCLCPPGVVGETCDTIVESDFSLEFTSAGMLDYAVWESGLRGKDLSQFTLCSWMKTTDRDNYGTVFSYATDSDANSLTLTDYSGFVFYVNGAKVVTDTTANDGKWHLICVTWSSLPAGQWRVFKDGELVDGGVGLSANSSVNSNGTAIVGQEQDVRGGGFSHAESFVGQIFGVELWNYVLDESTISSLTLKCHNSNSSGRGNVLTWADFKRGLRGGVRVEESPFCRGCVHPISPQYGSVSVVANEAIYECNRGYELAEGSLKRRPCLVHGGWSGPEPQCRRVSCNYPGYILNGLVNGTSYTFGDSVVYSCVRGFRLSGSPIRFCDEGSQWSGEAPECVPINCDKPLPPSNGSLSGEIKDSYSVGEQVKFQCSTGFRLDGPQSLTCQDEGSWDDVAPVCQPLACTQPPYVEHGIVTNGVAEIPPEDLPHYLTPGSVLTFTCHFGYQLESTDSVQCSHDGFWIGTIPKCVPIRCGLPPSILHATVHLSRPDDDRVGTVASYECQMGFEPYGPTELECTESGTWLDRNKIPSLPVCMLVDCGSVPTIENAEVYAEDQTYGSRARVTCYDGFKRVGHVDYVECRADKRWSEPPNCRPVACTEAPSIRNGTHSADPPFAAGELVEFNCTEGFQLSGNVGPMECLEDGSWRGDEPQCLPIECPNPVTIENGRWSYSSSEFDDSTIFYTGAEITYTCDNGYKLEGPAKRRCLGPVGWLPMDQPPFCRVLPPGTYCPPLENPVHGSVVVEGFEPSQTANFECDTGFQPNTDSTQLVCSSQGSWEPEIDFKCDEITCQEPSAPVNGSVRFTSVSFGSKVIFQCDQGFTLTGAQQRTCGSDGDWIGGTTPKCQPRKCTVPDIIEHGYIGFEVGGSATSLSTGSIILYDCEEGYKIVGPRERTCLSTGDWTEEEPSCQQIYCEKLPDRLPHGTIVGSDANIYGSVVQFSCDPGYELDGPETVSCEDDENWSGLLPTCRPIQCPYPGLIPHADSNLTKAHPNENAKLYHHGDVLKYMCHSGYSPLPGSNMERRCLADGSWTSNEPACRQVSCPPASAPLNGYVNAGQGELNAGAVAGQIIEYRCKAGYELSSGPTTATCLEEGNWDVTDPPICSRVSCPSPANIKNGKLNWSGEKTFVFDDKITYTCDEGFKLEGATELTCNASGKWSNLVPKCARATCPKIDPNQLKDGFIKPIYPEEKSSNTSPYMLKFACRVGYEIVGASTAQCKSTGEWNSPLPSCVPWPCDSPPLPQNGRLLSTDITDDALIARIQCEKGYNMAGGNLTCGPSGNWKGKVECRAQQCNPPLVQEAEPAAPLESTYQYGDEVVFQCPAGYVENTSVLVCNEIGKWTGELPVCRQVTCPLPESPANGYVNVTNNTIGSILRFSCQEGYTVEGNEEVSCLTDGNWSGDAGTCVPVTCDNPADIENGWMSIHGNRVGEIVTYSCSSGYFLSGKSERTCSINGQWSDSDPACDPVICPVPEVPEFGSWIVGGFVPGAAIRFECQTGFTLVGAATITCLVDKTWSDQPPLCQQVTCPPLKDPDHGKVQIIRWTSNNEELTNEIDQSKPAGYRSVASYKCNKGYQLFGPEQRMCSAHGAWTERGPQCQRIWCPEPQPPDQGFVMGIGRQYGDRIRYACSNGYKLVGHSESLCQPDGNWSVPPPKCQALTCSAPPPTVHHAAMPSLNKTVVGTQVKIRCLDGYAPIGDLILNCLPNQQWSEVKGHCKKVHCPRPTVKGASSVAVIGGSGIIPANGVFRFGDRIVITCQNSRKHRGNNAVLVCSANGQWSGQLPNCEGGDCDNFCFNGGSCALSAYGSKKCTCPHGYTGDRCQHAYCILPCLNSGTCVAPYRCACRPSYTGKRCETPICEHPCLNGGRCVSPNVCHCPPGTAAPNCRKKSADFFSHHRGK